MDRMAHWKNVPTGKDRCCGIISNEKKLDRQGNNSIKESFCRRHTTNSLIFESDFFVCIPCKETQGSLYYLITIGDCGLAGRSLGATHSSMRIPATRKRTYSPQVLKDNGRGPNKSLWGGTSSLDQETNNNMNLQECTDMPDCVPNPKNSSRGIETSVSAFLQCSNRLCVDVASRTAFPIRCRRPVNNVFPRNS
ncbi:UNVERIFIED_CONTAM: hypothetical protein PYX00_001906 [Menopon gallinae]|uniref:Uncharacterized protein n=1 Tax=Menopon gallinae TaxID=328185 RepID=A0AAW2IEV6_9NEOP